jgi:hypothetical protein
MRVARGMAAGDSRRISIWMRSPAYDPHARTAAIARVGLFGGAVAYSWVAGGLDQNSLPATAAIVLPGIVGVWLARRRPARREPANAPTADPRGAITWALWLLAFLLWEAGAFFFQESPTIGNYDHPTLSLLVEPFLEPQPVRALGYLAWLAGGWRLLRR